MPAARSTTAKKTTAKPPAKTAQRKGRQGTNKLSTAAAAKRHAKVIELRASGLAWASVAVQVGLAESSCKEVWKKWSDEGKLEIQGTDPIAVVLEQITRLDVAIGELAEIASNKTNQAAARVGAIGAKARLMAQQVELLQAVGLMPKQLGRLAIELDVRFVSQQMFVILEKYVPKARLAQAENEFASLIDRGDAVLEAG